MPFRYTHTDRRSGYRHSVHGDLWRSAPGCARYVNDSQPAGFASPQVRH